MVQNIPCRQSDPEIWFDQESVDLAVSLCQECPIKANCLKLAQNMTDWPLHGVWGGLTAFEIRSKTESSDTLFGR